MKQRRVIAALLAITAAVSVVAAPAYSGDHKHRSLLLQLAQSEISSDQAAAIASRATGGRVLKVKRKGGVYHVRVLLDGDRVRKVHVDARTGRVQN